MIFIFFKKFDEKLPGFYKECKDNAGYDLFARVYQKVMVAPQEVVKIPLNVATSIPNNCVGLLFQRSSTYTKWGLKLTNSVGVIDSLFCGDRDEWMAEFKNEKDHTITIQHGDKLCQALFIPLYPIQLKLTDVLGNKDRGGFGTSFDNAKEANTLASLEASAPAKDKAEAHASICEELNSIYKKKNSDYGDSFGKSFTSYGMPMACIRLQDKLSRLVSLTVNRNEKQVEDESIEDTLMDLANYAIMTLIELEANNG